MLVETARHRPVRASGAMIVSGLAKNVRSFYRPGPLPSSGRRSLGRLPKRRSWVAKPSPQGARQLLHLYERV